MNDSMAQPDHAIAPVELPGWKTTLSWVAAILTSLLFLMAGLWKITDAPAAAVRMAQARVPQDLSLAAALVFGIAETFAGVLILVPRFRRWGATLASILLVAFMLYIGVHYNVLRGEECSCFPWIKRAIGPGFFVADTAMLALAILAGVWAKPGSSKRSAVLVLAAVSVFALVSYGVEAASRSGVKAPDSITVNGQPFSLQQGRIFLFFFNPECPHCLDAARRMAKLNWGDTKIVAVPTQQPQFAQEFMRDTGLKASLSNDAELLHKTFAFTATPAGVALENGRLKQEVTDFEDPQFTAAVKRLGFVR